MPSSESAPPLKDVLDASERLPAFPDVVWKVMPLVRDMAPVQEIEAVIKYDPVITAKVLSFSQSAHYARRQVITSLRDAIVLMGQQQLVQIVMAACASRFFQSESANGYDLREGELWEHAVAAALMTEIVGRRLGYEDIFSAYTAALLHDIGKTVLHLYVKTYFDSILSLVREKKMRFLDAERQVLGIDHQQLGTMIASRWKFPAEVTTAIEYHHYPLQAKENRTLVSIIHVADRMVSAMGIGCGVDSLMQPNQDQVFVELGITSRMVDQCLADLVEALRETKQFLAS